MAGKRTTSDVLLFCRQSVRLQESEEILRELLEARELQYRTGLWPVRFPRIRSEPGGAARRRFARWYARATRRVIDAEERARDFLRN